MACPSISHCMCSPCLVPIPSPSRSRSSHSFVSIRSHLWFVRFSFLFFSVVNCSLVDVVVISLFLYAVHFFRIDCSFLGSNYFGVSALLVLFYVLAQTDTTGVSEPCVYSIRCGCENVVLNMNTQTWVVKNYRKYRCRTKFVKCKTHWVRSQFVTYTSIICAQTVADYRLTDRKPRDWQKSGNFLCLSRRVIWTISL